MTASKSPYYDRAPSAKLRKALAEGFLAPVVNCPRRSVAGCSLDVHFRVGDEVHVYCGHANLMRIKLESDGSMAVNADPRFRDQACGKKLFGRWTGKESDFEGALDLYLNKVEIRSSLTGREGRLQAQWSRIRTDPWTPFDRECVLAGMGKETEYPEVDRALRVVENIAVRSNRRRQPWDEPERPTGRELDQIAVDEDGKLVLIELKDANSRDLASVFYSPLQLLGYVHQWHKALMSVAIRKQLQELIDARRDVGLTSDLPSLRGGVRAAICFGVDARSDEVKRRFYEVLGVANAHLPDGVMPIETWRLDSKFKPQSL